MNLQPELDYDVDYIQGRVLLSEPLSTIASDRLLVRSDGLSGNEVWLVVQYEYTPGFDEVDTLNSGGQAHVWLDRLPPRRRRPRATTRRTATTAASTAPT